MRNSTRSSPVSSLDRQLDKYVYPTHGWVAMGCGLIVGLTGGNFANHPERKWELIILAVAIVLWIVDFKSIFAHWRVQREKAELDYMARMDEIRKRYGQN